MSKQALKRFRRAVGLPVNRDPIPEYLGDDPRPVYYLFADGGVICAKCCSHNLPRIDPLNVVRNRFSHGGAVVNGFERVGDDPGAGEPIRCDNCRKVIPTGDPPRKK